MVATSAEPSALPDYVLSPDDLTGDLFVAHVKSRQEKAFAAELNRTGVGYYLPLAERVSHSGKRRYLVSEPVLAGYVFVAGDEHTPASVMGTGRVCRTIPVRNQARLRHDLSNLFKALEVNPRFGACEHTKGQRVRITSGAYMGIEGVILRLKNSAILVLEVEGFGQASIELEIDGLKVESV